MVYRSSKRWKKDHDGNVDSLIARAASYMASRFPQSKCKLKLRFRNQFCYLEEALEDGRTSPLGRLRYFNPDQWSAAFFAYSDERYHPCLLSDGKEFGSFEEGIEVCAVYQV